MTSRPRHLFVTTALPYANGPFHIGHIMEYIQADIWVRFQRMVGNKVHWMGADDAHGAPIMLKAESEGITPEQLVTRIAADRPKYLEGFHIAFDNWHSTHSPENTQLTQRIFRELQEAGLVYVKAVEQFFDPVKNMFLADRYVKGECPNCHAKDQYGDTCEVCSKAYEPTDLINPYSTLSGATPVRRTSDHYFVKLSEPRCKQFMREWLNAEQNGKPRLQPAVRNKANEWLEGEGDQALTDKDISRDAPYFGIPIPGATGKYFYVWFDAPIGYLASLKNYFDSGKARANGEERSFDEFLAAPDVEQIHFIGKDIIYFHTLLWPAMLKFAGEKVPDNVYVHGFITVSGAKMSKSRGTGISPLRYLDVGMNPEWLRYYIAAKLNANVEDIDFNPEDFIARVNSDLVGKYVNIASRMAPFIAKFFDNRMPPLPAGSRGISAALEHQAAIRAAFDEREFGKAIRLTMEVADAVNAEIDVYKPWILSKDAANNPDNLKKLGEICASSMATFKALTLFLKPILPALAEQAEGYLNSGPLDWNLFERGDAASLLPAGHHFGTFKPLITRVDPKQLDALFESANEAAKKTAEAPASGPGPTPQAASAAEITVDDFAKLDIRIAKIVAAETVDGADKLLKLTVDIGDAQRTVFAGIRSAYTPEQLAGRLTLVLANLKPRKMKFGTSEGMVLAAGPGGKDIFLLSPDAGATPGMKVK
ncbi:MAG TPA: methionine--tRNA ligase [Povalibacter sp.]|uniref:methionine--tRNA ligase n=1 Tax=Povalibacter sp. TaxID=1962978 RepID=UPI002CBD61E4|nr:methionine--tRNA ligase [Povalibacter sp.]HMN43478.1 methionine--tRNA ligase [Povalibacter sp.]